MVMSQMSRTGRVKSKSEEVSVLSVMSGLSNRIERFVFDPKAEIPGGILGTRRYRLTMRGNCQGVQESDRFEKS